MSDLTPGCTAIVVKSSCAENIGKIVKVGSFIGKVDSFIGADHWEIDREIRSTYCFSNQKGGMHRFCTSSQLQRIDDHKEKQYTKQIQKLTV